MKKSLFQLSLCSLLLVFCVSLTAQAQQVVTKTADTNDGVCDADCSLREAIAVAASGNTITFAAPLFDTTQIIRVNGQLLIAKNLIVTGSAANLLTVRNIAANSLTSRVFQINSGFTVGLSGMTITGGNTNNVGGGISNGGTLTLTGVHLTNNVGGGGGGIENSGTLTVINSTISNNTVNSSLRGGGIENTGTLTVTNSTISGNRVTSGSANGGGIWSAGVSVTITNCTITDNEAAGGAASASGIFRFAGAITVRNTIIAANRNNPTTPDVNRFPNPGTFTSDGYNIIGNAPAGNGFTNGVNNDQSGDSTAQINPLVFPLGNYGGGVPTHALRRFPVASPAIDNGANGVTTDFRGVARPFDEGGVTPTTTGGNSSDIGAFEHLPYVNDLQGGFALANNGAGSLRDTFAAVPAGSFVIFDPDFFGNSYFMSGGIARTISLSGGQIEIVKNISFVGTTANALTIQNTAAASTTSRVFVNNSFGIVSLSGMTVTGGNLISSGGGGIGNVSGTMTLSFVHVTGNVSNNIGGGLRNFIGSTMNVYHSTVSSNTSTGRGGGIDNSGTLTVINSTISGNRVTAGAANGGGGIASSGGAPVNLINSTITDNEVPATTLSASGFWTSGTVTVRNSIIAANRNNSFSPDVIGAFTSNGYNLIGNRGTVTGFNQTGDQTGSNPFAEIIGGGKTDFSPQAVLDPLLSPLALIGGTVPTHAINSNSSPALDKGNCFGCSLDGRGLNRPMDLPSITNAASGDGSDIGAFEAQAVVAAAISIAGRILTTDGRGLRNARVTLVDQNGNSRTALTGAFGYYSFTEIEVGQTVIISVSSKRFQFAPQVVSVSEELTNLDFIAQEQ